jgi:hypothetical protein
MVNNPRSIQKSRLASRMIMTNLNHIHDPDRNFIKNRQIESSLTIFYHLFYMTKNRIIDAPDIFP